MIGATRDGLDVSITGLGCKVPDRVVTNEELAQHVDTTDEWIRERTGIRERRMASKEEALSDVALPAARTALAQAGVEGKDIDLRDHGRQARRDAGGGVRPARRVHRLRLRARAGVRDGCGRPLEARARR